MLSGKRPLETVAVRSGLAGRGAVAVHLAALDVRQKVRQAKGERGGDGLRADAFQRQGQNNGVARFDVGADRAAGVAGQGVAIQGEARSVIVGVGAESVGPLVEVVQAVVVRIGQVWVGVNPDQPGPTGQGDFPAAHPLTAFVLVVDLFGVGQAVAVRIRVVYAGADAVLKAVVQAVAVGVGVEGIGAQVFLRFKFKVVGEAVAVRVPQVGVGAILCVRNASRATFFLAVEQAVAVPIGVGKLVPVPQAGKAVRQHVQVKGRRVPFIIVFQILRHVNVVRLAPAFEPAQSALLVVDFGVNLGFYSESIVPPGRIEAVLHAHIPLAGQADAVQVAVSGFVFIRGRGPYCAAFEAGSDVAVLQVIILRRGAVPDFAYEPVSDLEAAAGDQPLRRVGRGGVEIHKISLFQVGQFIHRVKEIGNGLDDGPADAHVTAGGKEDYHVHYAKDGHQNSANGIEADGEHDNEKDAGRNCVGEGLVAGDGVVKIGGQAKHDPDGGQRNDDADDADDSDGEPHPAGPAKRLAGLGPAGDAKVASRHGPLDALEGV